MGDKELVIILHFLFRLFDLRASHARTLLPAALASVPFGFVLVRVRVRIILHFLFRLSKDYLATVGCDMRRVRRHQQPTASSQQALLSVGPDIWFSPRAESGRRPETVCDRDTTQSCSANAHLCTPVGKSSSWTTAG